MLVKLASWYKLNSNDGYDVFCTVCAKDESVRVKVTVESLYSFNGGLIGLIVPPPPVLAIPTVAGIFLTESS